jgi:hypothetical protein
VHILRKMATENGGFYAKNNDILFLNAAHLTPVLPPNRFCQGSFFCCENTPVCQTGFASEIPKTRRAVLSISGSVKFLLLSYEIQSTGSMKEGTVPVPPYRPCA